MSDNFPLVRPTAATYATAAAGGTATITLPASLGESWVVAGIGFSASADPTAGQVKISVGGVVLRDYRVTKGGPGQLTFSRPLRFDTNADVVLAYVTGGGTGVPTIMADAFKAKG